MRVVFFGCDDFAAVNLEKLIDDGHKVVGLVTQPDRPKGRGMHISFSPTKQIALAHNIEVFQPLSLKDPVVVKYLASFNADVFVVIAYGQFLSQEILDLPKVFCVNAHASLLPKYRGAAPINWAIINSETHTGITLMKMSVGMDAGDIIVQSECDIDSEELASELRIRLAHMSADLLSQTLPQIKAGAYRLVPQEAERMSKAPKMTKELGHINWAQPAKWAHDLVRGVHPWPGAFTFWRGARLGILYTEVVDIQLGVPGEIVEVHKDGFIVQTVQGGLLVKKVHPASSRVMDARAFLAGHKVKQGDVLG